MEASPAVTIALLLLLGFAIRSCLSGFRFINHFSFLSSIAGLPIVDHGTSLAHLQESNESYPSIYTSCFESAVLGTHLKKGHKQQ